MSAGLSSWTIRIVWSLACLAQQPGQPALERIETQVQADSSADIVPGYLGLIADDRQDPGRGIRITELVAASPAEQAGLLAGDVIVAINGQAMRTMRDMERVMSVSPAGTELVFQVQRGGERRDVKVALTHRQAGGRFGRIPDELPTPRPDQAAAPRAYLGVRATEATGEILRQAGLPSLTLGAAVQSVVPGSPAEKANIPAGAVIVGANDEAVNSPHDLLSIVARAAPGDSLELSFYNAGRLTRRTVKLEEPRPALSGPPPLPQGETARRPPSAEQSAFDSAADPAKLKPAAVEPPNAVPAPRIEVLERRDRATGAARPGT